jgi:hypothetical protein
MMLSMRATWQFSVLDLLHAIATVAIALVITRYFLSLIRIPVGPTITGLLFYLCFSAAYIWGTVLRPGLHSRRSKGALWGSFGVAVLMSVVLFFFVAMLLPA